MLATIPLDSAPMDEPCVPVSVRFYDVLARSQCNRYIRQLRKQYGPEPPLAKFSIQCVAHHLGSFYRVSLCFETDAPSAAAYARSLLEHPPLHWT
jgi:hypothetical protein